MKCICGYVEPQTVVEEIEIKFQSGPRKGQVKRVDERVIEPKYSDLFIRISVEKDFSFMQIEKSYYGNEHSKCLLYACPKCGTVKLFGVD
jgi:hypothetical protein